MFKAAQVKMNKLPVWKARKEIVGNNDVKIKQF